MKDRKSLLPRGFTSPALLSGLSEDTPILAAFSGGADSSALLHALVGYSKLSGAKIYAAHVNHGIRGDEADRDEEFCRQFADSLGVELFVLRADVPSIAALSGESIETAARRVRYEYFERIMQERSIPVLATAHNANDNLETLIFNIARGTGLGGLCGIPESRPMGERTVIRPMLNMEKADILDYCSQNSISFVTDSTNTDTDYTRNLIRARIIPVMTEINSGAVRNAKRMCRSLREDSLCLESMAGWFVEELSDGYSVELEKICSSPASVVNRALIRLYDELSGGMTLEQTHIDALCALARRGVPHSSVSLPGGFEGAIENARLCLRRTEAKPERTDYCVRLEKGENFISQTNSEIFISTSHNSKNIYKKSTILYIDFATIKGDLVARPRRPQDKIRTCGMTKSLKKLMCDKKIPIELRDRLPVICDDDGIIAVPFVAVRDSSKIRKNAEQEENALCFYLY